MEQFEHNTFPCPRDLGPKKPFSPAERRKAPRRHLSDGDGGGWKLPPLFPIGGATRFLGGCCRLLPHVQGCGAILIESCHSVSNDQCKVLVYPGTATPGHIPTLMYR